MVMDVEIIFRVQTQEVFQVQAKQYPHGHVPNDLPWDLSNQLHYSYDDALDAGNLMLAQHPNVAGFVIAKSYQRIEEDALSSTPYPWRAM